LLKSPFFYIEAASAKPYIKAMMKQMADGFREVIVVKWVNYAAFKINGLAPYPGAEGTVRILQTLKTGV
jgi:hypothetical protein